jgi:phage baseplate assembly protein gpV
MVGSKYIGYTSQQLNLSITQEEAEYKQNGVAVESVPISKMAEATFRLDQWDTDTFAWALGLADKLVDAVTGKKRVVISADNIKPEDWYIKFVTETVDGTPVEFHIPRGNVNIDGDLTFGGGNDSPNFGGTTVRIKALAATINEIGRAHV